MLLVDDDQAEPADRREDRRAGADDDARLAARDPLTLVAPLRVGEPRVEDRDPVAEARADPADGLRRERDLGHEHDRAEPALEHRGARLEVHLGLAGAGRAVEQEVSPSPASIAATIRAIAAAARAELRRLVLAGERLPLGRAAPAPCAASASRERRARARAPGSSRSSRRARARARRAPAGPRRPRPRSAARRLPRARASSSDDDDPARPRAAERHAHDRAASHALRDLVGERTRDGARRDERVDRRVGHDGQRRASSATRRFERNRLNDRVRAISPIASRPEERR